MVKYSFRCTCRHYIDTVDRIERNGREETRPKTISEEVDRLVKFKNDLVELFRRELSEGISGEPCKRPGCRSFVIKLQCRKISEIDIELADSKEYIDLISGYESAVSVIDKN